MMQPTLDTLNITNTLDTQSTTDTHTANTLDTPNTAGTLSTRDAKHSAYITMSQLSILYHHTSCCSDAECSSVQAGHVTQ